MPPSESPVDPPEGNHLQTLSQAVYGALRPSDQDVHCEVETALMVTAPPEPT